MSDFRSQANSSAGKGDPVEKGRKLGALLEVFRSRDLRRLMPGLLLASLLSNVLALALPLAILQVLDRVVVNKSLGTLALLALGVILALLLEEVLRTVTGLITSWLGTRFEHNASIAALHRLMRVPMRRYLRDEPGAYAEKVLASSKVAEFYSGQALMVLFDLPFVVVFLSLLGVIGGWLVVVPVTLLGLFVVLIAYFGRWMRGQVQQRAVVEDRRYNFLAEVLGGIHSVKTLMMESIMQRRYERLQQSNAEQWESLTHGSTVASGIGGLFSQVMIVAVVFAGSWVVIQGQMTPGGLAASIMLSVRSLQPLRRALSVWLRYQSFVTAHERLHEVMALPHEDDADKPELSVVRQGLTLRNIRVSYGAGGALFSGLSLEIEAGQCIAIQGDSGKGKTSLLSLMNGMVHPDEGEVLVDGHPIEEFSSSSVYRQIAFLPQSGTVVSGTILENLTMFDSSLNSRALDVAEKLGLDRIVAGMRLGYETALGENSAENLPLGVRQLITIVRGLVRDPSVILFDEANISLDIESDKRLRAYLEEVKGKVTLVLVTYRPSLLSMADRVYAISEGQLVEVVREKGHGSFGAEDAPVAERPMAGSDLDLVVHQHFDEESDLARCLVPLLERLGWQGRARELAETLPHMARNLDVSGFCSVMANLGYQPRLIHGGVSHIDSRLLPCLFVPDAEPAKVVLEQLPNGHLRAFDGGSGEMVDLDPGKARGTAYLYQPPDQHDAQVKDTFSWFGKLFWRFRYHIVLAFVLTVVSTALSLATPLFVMAVYDWVLPAADIRMGAYLVLGVSLAIFLNGIVLHFKSRVMAYIGGRTEYVLGTSVFQRIIGLPASASDGASVSRQIGRIKSLEGLRDFFLGPLALLAFELPANLLMLLALGLINPWAVVVVLAAVLAFVVLGHLVRGISEQAVNRSSRFSSMRWELLNEALTSMRTIRSVGAGPVWVERFREMSGKAGMAGFADNQVRARVSGITKILGTSTGAMALFVSAILAVRGDLSGGAIVATMMIIWRIVGPLQNAYMASTTVVRMRTTLKQIENLMRLPGERDGGVRQTIRPESRGQLTLSRVSFRYTNDADPALLGVSFSVPARHVVVITGPDGSGKSTLLKLLVRVFMPQAGTIRLDNVDIRQLTALDLRSQVSYMPQNCEIFYGTIAQNLRFAHPSASDEELYWALDMAGLAEEIKALPEGLETRISSSRSDQLPHGFRQRLSLARTMLKPATVVLLDEPGAGLDDGGEEALLRCIKWLRGRATLVIVSHRPGHMRLADNVVYLERGAITAMGPFEQLKEKIMSGLR